MSMRVWLRLAGTWLLACLSLCPSQVAAQDKPIVAVQEIDDDSGSLRSADLASSTDYLRATLIQTGVYSVVDRGRQEAKKDQIVKQMKRESQDPCYDEKCRIELGRALAADTLLSCRVSKLGRTCLLSCEMIPLEKEVSDRAGTAKFACGPDGVVGAVEEVVRELAGSSRTYQPVRGRKTHPAPLDPVMTDEYYDELRTAKPRKESPEETKPLNRDRDALTISALLFPSFHLGGGLMVEFLRYRWKHFQFNVGRVAAGGASVAAGNQFIAHAGFAGFGWHWKLGSSRTSEVGCLMYPLGVIFMSERYSNNDFSGTGWGYNEGDAVTYSALPVTVYYRRYVRNLYFETGLLFSPVWFGEEPDEDDLDGGAYNGPSFPVILHAGIGF